MATLTIRNLTIHPLELLSVERFEAERVDTGGNLVSSVAGAITGFLNATAAQRPTHELRPRGAAHATEKASVHVPAFAARPTGLRTADPGGREVIRLTVSVAGRKYETDVPSPSKRSASMRAVDGDGEDNNEGGKKKKLELTAVYVPTGALVAVFSSANLSSWMRELHDDRPLTVLSIPGTHNAPTCHTALPSVRCQAVPVRDQLDNGVRFLDVRVNADADAADDRRPSLTLVHSAFPVSLAGSKNLSGLLADVYAFLDRNPRGAEARRRPRPRRPPPPLRHRRRPAPRVPRRPRLGPRRPALARQLRGRRRRRRAHPRPGLLRHHREPQHREED